MSGHRSLAATLLAVFALAGCAADDSGDQSDQSEGATRTRGPVRPAGPGETCLSTRAIGAVSRYEKALHDMIAFAEGTEKYGAYDGYNVFYTFRQFTSCNVHPNKVHCDGGLCSTAAGRYQFLTRTWNSVARGISAYDFEPETQEDGAKYLIQTVRRVRLPADRPMTAAEFSSAMAKLSYEWASLPPGRYGQPKKSMTTMRNEYCSNLGPGSC